MLTTLPKSKREYLENINFEYMVDVKPMVPDVESIQESF